MVDHPKLWPFCGYNEIQDPAGKYRILDLDSLVRLTRCTDLPDLQAVHKRLIKGSLQADELERESHWTESIASGSKSFIEKVKQSLGFKAKGKSITGSKDRYQLREDVAEFGNTSLYGLEPIVRSDAGTTNTILWRNYS